MKKLYIFDLDGTLAPSKSPLEPKVINLLLNLLAATKVAIITGGTFDQLEKQCVSKLGEQGQILHNLYLLPTSGAALYIYDEEHNSFRAEYEELLTPDERRRIIDAFHESFGEINFEQPAKLYGEQIEDRGSQVSFSGLGQQAPLSEKHAWDPERTKRAALQAVLVPKLPDFEVRVSGSTTIDVTRKGVDKAYGIRKILEYLKIPVADAVFVGDALFEGGNDAPAKETGIETVPVTGPEETGTFTEKVLTEAIV